MPDSPGLNALCQWNHHCKTIKCTAEESDKSENQRRQQFVSLIHAEAEGLQEEEDEEDDGAIHGAVS